MAQSTELAVPSLPRGRPLYTEYLRRDGLDSWQEDARSVCDPGARRTSSMLHMQMEMHAGARGAVMPGCRMLFAVELVMSVSIVWVVPCAHLERRVLYAWPFLRVCTFKSP